MLSRDNRLPATTKLVHAQYIKTPVFGMKYTRNGLQISRFAFVVKKSVDKRAVVRNRIRRVFRSCIEEQVGQIAPGYNMLFFLEKGIIEKRQQDLCQEVRTILLKKQLLQ